MDKAFSFHFFKIVVRVFLILFFTKLDLIFALFVVAVYFCFIYIYINFFI